MDRGENNTRRTSSWRVVKNQNKKLLNVFMYHGSPDALLATFRLCLRQLGRPRH